MPRHVLVPQGLSNLLVLLLLLLGGHERVADDTGDQPDHGEAAKHHIDDDEGNHNGAGIDPAENRRDVVPPRERLDGEQGLP